MSCDNIHSSHPMVTASLPSFNEALSDTFYDSLPSHEPDNGGAVEIDTGDGDVSAVLKYVVANAAYTKGLKSSPVWKYFAHFDAVQHPDKKNHRICLLCRELGIDKSISVGKDYSNTPPSSPTYSRSINKNSRSFWLPRILLRLSQEVLKLKLVLFFEEVRN